MEKQKTLYQQARLHERGAAEMVLQMISASKGDFRDLCMGPLTNTEMSPCDMKSLLKNLDKAQ